MKAKSEGNREKQEEETDVPKRSNLVEEEREREKEERACLGGKQVPSFPSRSVKVLAELFWRKSGRSEEAQKERDSVRGGRGPPPPPSLLPPLSASVRNSTLLD
ncbi:unnamed protein product [Pleuronectes platessa]|uniref:Uncharacterized protein n=1 Tax=Pleuronectes platessa TaxID=8262 RepID=A0A9N7Z5I8_PLEPL|nr:unnamed protein product [Pleuronectes platessa]